jgi:ankyrin repeat protein
MLQYYIEKGAKIDMPPDKVSPLYTDGSKTREYRKSPFTLQSVCHNSLDCLNVILRNGGKITDQGYIGLSRKKKNQVISNAIGAAAFNGSTEVLKQLLK